MAAAGFHGSVTCVHEIIKSPEILFADSEHIDLELRKLIQYWFEISNAQNTWNSREQQSPENEDSRNTILAVAKPVDVEQIWQQIEIRNITKLRGLRRSVHRILNADAKKRCLYIRDNSSFVDANQQRPADVDDIDKSQSVDSTSNQEFVQNSIAQDWLNRDFNWMTGDMKGNLSELQNLIDLENEDELIDEEDDDMLDEDNMDGNIDAEVADDVDYEKNDSQLDDEYYDTDNDQKEESHGDMDDAEKDDYIFDSLEEGQNDNSKNDAILKAHMQRSTDDDGTDEMEAMERELVSEKTWTMKGEISAIDRPKNSLLETVLDIPVFNKPVSNDPQLSSIDFKESVSGIGTSTFNVSNLSELIEKIVKYRISNALFDDVIARNIIRPAEKPDGEAGTEKETLIFEKSKMGLGDIYAAKYAEDVLGHASKDKKALDKNKESMAKEFASIVYKLDCLSSFSFVVPPASNYGIN